MIPIFKPFMPENIGVDIEKNLYSGNLAYGKYGKLFEEKIGSYIGNNLFISTATYNYALLIVLSALGLKEGDEIIASPVSCLASNQPFVVKGLKIIWVDIDPNTGSICLEDLKKKITKKTKAVFVNYYCGYLAQIEDIFELVKLRYGIYLIDDAIEAFGAIYKGAMVGNLYADATVFSFQTVRLPNTIDGGGISFKDLELYNKASLIRDYGIDRGKFRDKNGEISKDCDIELEGYGALMSEVNSIIGCRQIPFLDTLLSKQRENAEAWERKLQDISEISSLSTVTDSLPNYWVYGIISQNKLDTILKFRNSGFFATGVHLNNNSYSVFKNASSLKGVNEFMKSFIGIPSGWWLDKLQIQELRW